MDIDAYAARVKAAFEAKGHEIDVAVVEAAEMEKALRHAATEVELDGLIAGGGDGTISTAAGIAWKSGLALGVIPAGTMNLLPARWVCRLMWMRCCRCWLKALSGRWISPRPMVGPSCISFRGSACAHGRTSKPHGLCLPPWQNPGEHPCRLRRDPQSARL